MNLQSEIILSKTHVEALKRHAIKSEPNESCAILLGRTGSGRVSVTDVFLTKNDSPSPTNFTISNEEIIKAYQESERKKIDVVAIFHSHPHSTPFPSSTDCAYMEVNPVPWVIYSNISDELRAYILESEPISINVRVL